MAIVRRRRVKKRAARKNPARVRAGKKAARTRVRRKTARKNPARRVRRAAVRRAPMKRRIVRRRNPSKAVSQRINELRQQASALGLSTKGTTRALEARIARKGASAQATAKPKRTRKPAAKKATAVRSKPKAKARKKMTRTQALAKARRARRVTGKYSSRARSLVKRGKNKTARSISRTYLAARGISKRANKGQLSKENAKLAKAMGLTRINPSMKAIGQDALVMLSRFGAAGAGVIGGVVIGLKLGSMLQAKLPAATPAFIRNNAVPLTTLGLAAGVWTGMKLGKKTQSWAMPVGLGIGAAGALFMLTHTKMGQDLLGKMGITMAIKAVNKDGTGTMAAPETKPDGTAAGLGAYVLGEYVLGQYVESEPLGPRGGLEGYVMEDEDGSPGVHELSGSHQGIFAGLDDGADYIGIDEDDNYVLGEGGIFGGSVI